MNFLDQFPFRVLVSCLAAGERPLWSSPAVFMNRSLLAEEEGFEPPKPLRV